MFDPNQKSDAEKLDRITEAVQKEEDGDYQGAAKIYREEGFPGLASVLEEMAEEKEGE